MKIKCVVGGAHFNDLIDKPLYVVMDQAREVYRQHLLVVSCSLQSAVQRESVWVNEFYEGGREEQVNLIKKSVFI